MGEVIFDDGTGGGTDRGYRAGGSRGGDSCRGATQNTLGGHVDVSWSLLQCMGCLAMLSPLISADFQLLNLTFFHFRKITSRKSRLHSFRRAISLSPGSERRYQFDRDGPIQRVIGAHQAAHPSDGLVQDSSRDSVCFERALCQVGVLGYTQVCREFLRRNSSHNENRSSGFVRRGVQNCGKSR